MSYYQRNKEILIARQLAYYNDNREAYLAYMKEYNRKYYLKNYVPKPRVKKEKKEKQPKAPRPLKESKPKAPRPLKEQIVTFVAPESIMTTIRGNFTLSFV